MKDQTVCGDCHWMDLEEDVCCAEPPCCLAVKGPMLTSLESVRPTVHEDTRGCERFAMAEGKTHARYRTILEAETAWERWIDVYCFQLLLTIRGIEQVPGQITIGRGPSQPPLDMLEHLRDVVAKQQSIKSVLPKHDPEVLFAMDYDKLRALLIVPAEADL